jgi:tRNA threonylcarbamoyladenosine biosynthesis protein TsaE
MTIVESTSPEQTFALGQAIGGKVVAGQVILLIGGLGAGKTLLTKGILDALGFDIDEVTSPSFTLVNLYKTTEFDVYHIDIWRLESHEDAASAVGLDEILEEARAVTIIEWADRLGPFEVSNPTLTVTISGDGDEPRRIEAVGRNLPKI